MELMKITTQKVLMFAVVTGALAVTYLYVLQPLIYKAQNPTDSQQPAPENFNKSDALAQITQLLGNLGIGGDAKNIYRRENPTTELISTIDPVDISRFG